MIIEIDGLNNLVLFVFALSMDFDFVLELKTNFVELLGKFDQSQLHVEKYDCEAS